MSGYFAPLSRFPFTAAISGQLDSTDVNNSVDLTLPEGIDPAKANTLLIQNFGPATVWFKVGESGVVAAPSSLGDMDTTSCPILAGAIFTYPCPPIADAAIGLICGSTLTATVLVSRGWGQ